MTPPSPKEFIRQARERVSAATPLKLAQYDYQLERMVKNECESWADWDKLSLVEQNETLEGYFDVYAYGVKQMSKDADRLCEALEIALEGLEVIGHVDESKPYCTYYERILDDGATVPATFVVALSALSRIAEIVAGEK